MLVDHKIKLDVEAELKSPPPRLVRRRSGRGFPFGAGHLLILPFVILGLLLTFVLFKSLWVIIVERGATKSSIWALVFVTLFWNCCTLIFLWKIYALPLVYRWLVVNGRATLGRITGFSSGAGSRGGSLSVHYEFSPNDRLTMKSKSEVLSMKAWHELQEGDTIITILYSEKNPKWNVPYICADYEVMN